MTEQEWLTSDDPRRMIELMQVGDLWKRRRETVGYGNCHPITDRQLRLFACACCRQVWPHLTYPGSRQAVEVAERYADGLATDEELTIAQDNVSELLTDPPGSPQRYTELMARAVLMGPLNAIRDVLTYGDKNHLNLTSIQANLLRDIIGNPFRPVRLPTVEVIRACPSDDVMGGVMGGGPLSLVEICPWLTWRDGTIPALAEEAYQERVVRMCERCGGKGRYAAGWKHDVFGAHPLSVKSCPDCHGIGTIATGELDPARLAIIGDALEEAGCDKQSVEDCSQCGGHGWIGRLHHDGKSETYPCPVCQGGMLAHLRSPGPHVRGCWAVDKLRGVK